MELKSKGDIKERPVNEKEPFDLRSDELRKKDAVVLAAQIRPRKLGNGKGGYDHVFPSPEKCHRCLLSDSPCWVSSNLASRCSYCTHMHLSSSLVSNKCFDTACQQFRSLVREISTARQQLQANITLLNDLERRWEYFVEHGFPRVRFILLQDTPNLQSSGGPSAIDRSQDSSSFVEGFPEGTCSSFPYDFDSLPGIVWPLSLFFSSVDHS